MSLCSPTADTMSVVIMTKPAQATFDRAEVGWMGPCKKNIGKYHDSYRSFFEGLR